MNSAKLAAAKRRLNKQIVRNRKHSAGDCHCNYSNNYYGDQLCLPKS